MGPPLDTMPIGWCHAAMTKQEYEEQAAVTLPSPPACADSCDLGVTRHRPRQPPFRGAWRSLTRRGGKRLENKRGAPYSARPMKLDEAQMERAAWNDIASLIQEPSSTPSHPSQPTVAASRTTMASAKAAARPAVAPFARSSGPGSVAPPPPLAAPPVLPGFKDVPIARPSSCPPRQQRPASRNSCDGGVPTRDLPTPIGRRDVPAVAMAAKAYKNLSQGAAFFAARARPSSEGMRRSLTPAPSSHGGNEEDGEAALLRLEWAGLWAKTKKLPKWDFCRTTGPWANRMRAGSVMNYKQWGPDGPLWTLGGAK